MELSSKENWTVLGVACPSQILHVTKIKCRKFRQKENSGKVFPNTYFPTPQRLSEIEPSLLNPYLPLDGVMTGLVPGSDVTFTAHAAGQETEPLGEDM